MGSTTGGWTGCAGSAGSAGSVGCAESGALSRAAFSCSAGSAGADVVKSVNLETLCWRPMISKIPDGVMVVVVAAVVWAAGGLLRGRR